MFACLWVFVFFLKQVKSYGGKTLDNGLNNKGKEKLKLSSEIHN